MAKAIFTTRISPSYKDVPECWYHFPRTYLKQVLQTVGDFIIYYEPGRSGQNEIRGGRLSYFAVAEVTDVREDPEMENHFYAYVSNFLEFDVPVPFRRGALLYESALDREGGQLNKGAFRRAVRILPDHEFEAILSAGFTAAPDHDAVYTHSGLHEEVAAFQRPIIESVISRPFRDVKFTSQVRSAYRATCALTGLCIINGGGRPEVDAAHIRPVGDGHNGPDSVRNGLALSKTVHWMFDRGLVSLTDDHRILAAESLIPTSALKLLNADGRALIPESPNERPHPAFLKYHRDNIFKG